MIPQAFITEWAAGAPWPDPRQVEQDLILSRLIVEIASHPLLGHDLAFRGGTCLQKLYLPEALRYSEDLDYVRVTEAGGAGQYFDAIRALGTDIGLHPGRTATAGSMARMFLDTESEGGLGRIRVKIEINMDEGDSLLGIVEKSYGIASRWWGGQASVKTYAVEELLGTKWRALYQRDKGRDLFDLWLGLTRMTDDHEAIVRALNHYMKDTVFSYPQFMQNLNDKAGSREFTSDLQTLVTRIPDDFSEAEAIELVRSTLAVRLRNVPDDVTGI